jgi:hypothetical protein
MDVVAEVSRDCFGVGTMPTLNNDFALLQPVKIAPFHDSYNAQVHDTHHPVSGALYYEDQKVEG